MDALPAKTVFIGLGSNLESPLVQLEQALISIQEIPDTQLIQVSPFYGSKPVGPADQPDYVNAVAELTTTLDPESLLNHLQAIEDRQGRLRARRWGARTLDLDILLYGDLELSSERLIIPHAEIKNRDFVLKPLQDLAPDLRLPDGQGLVQLLANCPDNQLVTLTE